MHARNSFEYAVVRVVPRVEREEFINAGVIVFCLARNYLAARVEVNESKLLALCPALDLEVVGQHLRSVPAVCAGEGPLGTLSRRERFHWLVSPRSTMIQVSAVHTGLCAAPDQALDDLFQRLVSLG